MMRDREEYISPVWFAREPALEVRRWIGRVLLGLVIALLAFIMINNVISPDTSPTPTQTQQEELPAPV